MTTGQRRSSTTSDSPARAHLLEAAVSLLETGGPESATSRAVADRAGENLAAITYYFGSKEELISEAMVETARSLIEPVVMVLTDDELNPVSKLASAGQILYAIIGEHQNLLGGYLHTVAAAATDESLRAQIASLHRRLVSVLVTELEAQLDSDLLPDWVSPLPMAQLIVAVANGVAVAAAIDHEPSDRPEVDRSGGGRGDQPDSAGGSRVDPAAVGAQFAQLLVAAGRTPPASEIAGIPPPE